MPDYPVFHNLSVPLNWPVTGLSEDFQLWIHWEMFW